MKSGLWPQDSANLLQQMGNAIAHRGPDGSGVWFDQSYRVGFAHRRLSIQDLSPAGHQPFISNDDQVQLVFNGEIYNHPELKKELEALGYSYRSDCDTETVMHAYAAWGIDCLERLDGMFAFALHDSRIDQTFLVRDRIGIKPLYFSLQGEMLSFSSEIKALWVLPWMQQKRSKIAEYHYLTFMVAPSPLTIFEGVYKLPAGFVCTLDGQKNISFREWYSPLSVLKNSTDKNFFDRSFCVEKLTELLQKAVKKRMLADVPVGALLSGGLDSSLVVALMAESGGRLETCNISFDDSPAHDERIWAARVAAQFGTNHHEIILNEDEALNFCPQMYAMLDESLADPVCVPFYFLLKKVRQAGLSVVMAGEGADELFWGYPSYEKQRFINNCVQKTNQFIPAQIKNAVFSIASSMLPSDSAYIEHGANWAQNRSLFWGGAIGFSEPHKQSLGLSAGGFAFDDPVVAALCKGLSDDSFSFVDRLLRQLKEVRSSAEFCLQVAYIELKQRLPELLLMRVDKMSMAHSVETRVPFLDHQLLEFALQVPEQIKCPGNGVLKSLLKEVAEQFLPKDIIYRKKVGFGAPIVRWMKHQKLQELCRNNQLFSPAVVDSWIHSPHYKKALYAWMTTHLHNKGNV